MSRKPEWIFSYGTLQERSIQEAVFSRCLEGQADQLADFQRLEDQVYERYPVVRPQQGARVAGVAYALGPEELPLADAYEGPGYRRELLTLVSGRKAWVYLEKH